MIGEDILTVQQTADLIGINAKTIYKAIDDGRLPHIEILGRMAVKRADAEAYRERTRADGDKPKGRPKGSMTRLERGSKTL